MDSEFKWVIGLLGLMIVGLLTGAVAGNYFTNQQIIECVAAAKTERIAERCFN